MFTKPSFRPFVCCWLNANGFRPPPKKKKRKKKWRRCFQVLRCCLFTTLRGWWYDVTLLRVLYGRELWHILVFHILQLFLLLRFTCEMKGKQNLHKKISGRTDCSFSLIYKYKTGWNPQSWLPWWKGDWTVHTTNKKKKPMTNC